MDMLRYLSVFAYFVFDFLTQYFWINMITFLLSLTKVFYNRLRNTDASSVYVFRYRFKISSGILTGLKLVGFKQTQIVFALAKSSSLEL